MSTGIDAKNEQGGGIMETVRVVIHAIILAVIVRIFLFQPFNIPSESMVPTLLKGDYLFVSKFSYGYSKHSFPWSLGPFDGRVLASEPKRGDVAVFKLPTDNETDYIKRVIGLPGDQIQMISGVLNINGQPVKRRQIDAFRPEDGFGPSIPQYEETLPNGVTYKALDMTSTGDFDDTRVFQVPDGHYFMMGDNRDNSQDSRSYKVGPVPRENLVGRADLLFFSIGDGAYWYMPWTWPMEIRWPRLFSAIR